MSPTVTAEIHLTKLMGSVRKLMRKSWTGVILDGMFHIPHFQLAVGFNLDIKNHTLADTAHYLTCCDSTSRME